MKKESDSIIYSPSDLIRYLASPFASWLDRYNLENPGALTPDEQTEEQELLSRTGDEHERSILTGYGNRRSIRSEGIRNRHYAQPRFGLTRLWIRHRLDILPR